MFNPFCLGKMFKLDDTDVSMHYMRTSLQMHQSWATKYFAPLAGATSVVREAALALAESKNAKGRDRLAEVTHAHEAAVQARSAACTTLTAQLVKDGQACRDCAAETL
jgi:hypothetical protein